MGVRGADGSGDGDRAVEEDASRGNRQRWSNGDRGWTRCRGLGEATDDDRATGGEKDGDRAEHGGVG